MPPLTPGATPTPRPVSPRPRPDPTALRLAAGFIGVAASSAMVSAMLAPAPIDATSQTTSVQAASAPEIVHITRYVELKPGQTAPPQSVVLQQQAPAPKTVVVKTHQSGVKP